MRYSATTKRYFDFFGAMSLVIILCPLLLLLCIILVATQGKKIFYTQERSGKDRVRFNLIKFRTLESTDSSDLSIDNREFTTLGRFLRNSGLDELPQLINIIIGQMSLVGPRPMPVEYEKKYEAKQLTRFDVKPGITGYAQINGRNDISWKRRFELDIWYVEHQSFGQDIRILLKTLFLFFSKREDRKMPVFNGSN